MSKPQAFQYFHNLYIVHPRTGWVQSYKDKDWRKFMDDAQFLGINSIIMHQDWTPMSAYPEEWGYCMECDLTYLSKEWEAKERDVEDGLIPDITTHRRLLKFDVDDIRNIVHN